MQHAGAGIARAKAQVFAPQLSAAPGEQRTRPVHAPRIRRAAQGIAAIAVPSPAEARLAPRRPAMAQRFFGGSGLVFLAPVAAGSSVSALAGSSPQSSPFDDSRGCAVE